MKCARTSAASAWGVSFGMGVMSLIDGFLVQTLPLRWMPWRSTEQPGPRLLAPCRHCRRTSENGSRLPRRGGCFDQRRHTIKIRRNEPGRQKKRRDVRGAGAVRHQLHAGRGRYLFSPGVADEMPRSARRPVLGQCDRGRHGVARYHQPWVAKRSCHMLVASIGCLFKIDVFGGRCLRNNNSLVCKIIICLRKHTVDHQPLKLQYPAAPPFKSSVFLIHLTLYR